LGLHRAPSTHLSSPLAHRGEANSRATFLSDAPSVVDYLYAQRVGIIIQADAHGAVLRLGVALGVVYGLEGDAVGGDLYGGRQGRQLVRGLDPHADAAVVVVIGVGPQRPEEAEGVERWRPERAPSGRRVDPSRVRDL
jgi:hypothetical protein